MGKFIQRSTEVIKSAVQKLDVVAVQGVEAPVAMFLNDIEERIVEVPRDVIHYVDREVEVIKEVPVYIEKEVIKYVDRVEVKFVDVVKEIEKLVEVPVDVVRTIDKEVVKFVHKVPYWAWMTMAMELLTIIILIIK